jgi:mono/diheme cytochrome c family protein
MWKMVLGVIVVAGCTSGSLPTRSGTEPSVQPAAVQTAAAPAAPAAHKFTQGEVLYIRHCASCHGAAARGDGPLAKALEIQPRNLRRADLFTQYSESELVVRILHGKALPVPLDPGALSYTEADVNALSVYLRRLPTLPWERIDQGERAYDSLCLSCHGIYGRGDGPLDSTLPSPPRDLSAPAYQQQVTDQELFRIISEGKGAMPGTMDVLSVADREAVVAFVRLLSPGYELYDRHCALCHGSEGQPAEADLLELLDPGSSKETPPTFNEEYFRTHSEQQIRAGITHMFKMSRVVMPHFAGELTADQVRQILGYLRTLPPE